MKVIVRYSMVARGMSLLKASTFRFTREFDSLDSAREWLETTSEPVFGVKMEIVQ